MNIAFLGIGLMGTPMVHRLLAASHSLKIYNRTKSKAGHLKEKGAVICDTASEAVRNSDVVIVMLSEYSAIREVMLDGIITDYSGKTIIMMSTISPEQNVVLKDAFVKLGGLYIEAPVLGSIPQATEGKLFILTGGNEKLLNDYEPILKIMGNNITYFGEVGKASAAKLALNQLIVTLTAAFSMSLGFLRENNVDVEKFMEILRGSAIYAPTFDKKLDRMMERNFENPNFPVKHLLKDVNLMAENFGKSGIDVSILESIVGIIKHELDSGGADLDYSALYNSIHLK